MSNIYPSLPGPSAPPFDPQEWRFTTSQGFITELNALSATHAKDEKKHRKKVRQMHRWSLSLGGIGAASSAGGIAVSATGVGVFAGAPVAAAGVLMGGASVMFGTLSRRYARYLKKASSLRAAALEAISNIQGHLSRALTDGILTVEEFKAIEGVKTQYHREARALEQRLTREAINSNDREETITEIKRYLSFRSRPGKAASIG